MKIKLHIYPSISSLDTYGINMRKFNYETPEKILNWITNFDKTIIIIGTNLRGKKYILQDILCRSKLQELNILFSHAVWLQLIFLKYSRLSLGIYYFKCTLKNERAIKKMMRKLKTLKLWKFSACIIYLNNILLIFTGLWKSKKIQEEESN